MLNPPLSHLPDELLDSIVEHVAADPRLDNDKILYNLSLADRAFTQTCQKYIFRDFKISSLKILQKLKRAKKILDDKPSFANQVRTVQLSVSRDEWAWLFNDSTFISILQLLAKSPVPPHELHLGHTTTTGMFVSFIIEDPILVVRRLVQSFFSQTLTILHLTKCGNVPLPIFLICPRLREVFLDRVWAEMSYDEYPDNQCSGREPPPLEVFDYRDSHLLQKMITPPSRFNTPVVLWSSLRILTVTPREKEGTCLQPILDAACNTLEELYLTKSHLGKNQHLPLAGLVNLSNVSHLHVFSLDTTIICQRDEPRFAVLHDINIVLGTIPKSNKLTSLGFNFDIIGQPFRECLDQDWDGMYNEVIRISDGKPMEVELQIDTITPNVEAGDAEEEKRLYMCIMGKAGSLSDYPKICFHFLDIGLRRFSPQPSSQ